VVGVKYSLSCFVFMSRKTESGYLTPLDGVDVDVLKPFSRLLEGWFCIGKEDAWSILLSLVGCCLGNCCIEEYYDEYGGASPDVVLKFTGEPVERMTGFCNLLLRESGRMAKRARLFNDTYFSADYTDVVYSGRPGEYTLNVLETGKAKMKLRRAFRYGVSCVVRPGARYFLGVTPYKKGDGVRNTVSLLAGLTVGEVDFTMSMFDKAFATMDVFQDLEDLGKEYVLPYRKNKQLDGMWTGEQKLVDYTIRKNGGGCKTVKIYLQKDDEDGYHAYVFPWKTTLREAEKLVELYRVRWNQETGFRCRKKTMAWTKSPSASYRLLLFTMSLLISNLWFFLKQTGNHVRQNSFKRRFLDMIRRTQTKIGVEHTVFGTNIKKTSRPATR